MSTGKYLEDVSTELAVLTFSVVQQGTASSSQNLCECVKSKDVFYFLKTTYQLCCLYASNINGDLSMTQKEVFVIYFTVVFRHIDMGMSNGWGINKI
jgi:hypothetical protein